MSLLGNLLWIIFGGGLILFLQYLIAGIVLCLTIIGLPLGVQTIKLSTLSLFPFGKEIYRNSESAEGLNLLVNVLWILLGGIWISLTHIALAILCFITIIGIPFGKQHVKLASMALFPAGTSYR